MGVANTSKRSGKTDKFYGLGGGTGKTGLVSGTRSSTPKEQEDTLDRSKGIKCESETSQSQKSNEHHP